MKLFDFMQVIGGRTKIVIENFEYDNMEYFNGKADDWFETQCHKEKYIRHFTVWDDTTDQTLRIQISDEPLDSYDL